MTIKVVPITVNATDIMHIPGSLPIERRKTEETIAKDLEKQLNKACPPDGSLIAFVSSSEEERKYLAVFQVF